MYSPRRSSIRFTAAIVLGLLFSICAHPGVTAAQSMTITFDDVTAPCTFDEAGPLTTHYAAQGVTFRGPDPHSGGAIVNECGNPSTTGHSSPDYLAFNTDVLYDTGGTASGPETITFEKGVTTVSMVVGSSGDGTVTLTAYNGATQVDHQSRVLGLALSPVSVQAGAITSVRISFTSGALVVDNLTWTLASQGNVARSKGDCTKNGWRTHTRADGSPFKNQGQCIRYVNTGK